MSSRRAGVKKNSSVEISALQKELDTIKAERTDLLRTVTTLEKDNAELRVQLKSHKANVERLEKDKTALNTRIKTMEKAAPPTAEIHALQKELDTIKAERTNLLRTITTLEKDKAELRVQFEASKANIERLINRNQVLTKRVDELEKATPEVKVEDVASIFKNTLQSIQREMKEPEKAGELGYIVDKFEVEMKSGLNLKEGIRLVQPTAAELKPESLSTVKISFKAKPKLKIAEE
jgi:chromosome segregation ATPase